MCSQKNSFVLIRREKKAQDVDRGGGGGGGPCVLMRGTKGNVYHSEYRGEEVQGPKNGWKGALIIEETSTISKGATL